MEVFLTIIISVVIGIVIMQLVNFCVILITNENETANIYTSIFLLMPFILLIKFIIKKIIKFRKNRSNKNENKIL